MLRSSSGVLLAEPTAKLFTFNKELDFKFSHSPCQYYLVIKATYDIVLLSTNNQTRIEALKLRGDTIQLDLFNKLPNGEMGQLVQSYTNFAVGLKELAIRQGDIDPSFNCHGYCFGDSKYWINDDQVRKILQGDGYLESVGNDDVSVVVYLLEEEVKHTAKRYHSDSGFIYVSKAGVRGLEETVRIEDAARNSPYDNVKFYRSPKLAQ